ncbi:precorrin-6A reductase [Pseudoflavonifractor capillosus ATCC 29799]|uniref:Precorrin-6A reductase n=1 Tax=Pseudoflavonifractor capillosus ATCC 29799 TaxID=411467 RepID=A6NSF1_9FIRM|nr:precorrin-6A reductase [Pseudoflavonifractor capillosus]EDN01189.1 precorrin-6A reductase [Pseudoflavonifractor capillosus ATCC 29799]
MEILLFGGTTEGRMLAQWLDERGDKVTYCAATEYGGTLIPEGAGVTVHVGRLDQNGMAELLAAGHFDYVVDATHPYASVVSANLKGAAGEAGVPYLRLVREDVPDDESWFHAPDAKTAAEMLLGMEGNILLTTGSKELDCYAVPGLRERVFPRVLPALDSLNRCLELGFPPAHIICMQGPFSKELNIAMMKQFNISVMVTKASGKNGGFWQKAAAAAEVRADLLLIDRPCPENGLTMLEMKSFLNRPWTEK